MTRESALIEFSTFEVLIAWGDLEELFDLLNLGPLPRVGLWDVILLVLLVTVFLEVKLFLLDALYCTLLHTLAVCLEVHLGSVFHLRQVIVVWSNVNLVKVRHVGAWTTHALIKMVDAVKIGSRWTPVRTEGLGLWNHFFIQTLVKVIFTLNSEIRSGTLLFFT